MTDIQIHPKPVLRKDYRPPTHLVEKVDLTFELDPAATRVRARMQVRRQASGDPPLVLDGQDLELVSLRVDGQEVPPASYTVDEEHLTISGLPEFFVLETEVFNHPLANTTLSGLYVSSGNFCTQCEAEGFRRITWFLDRPDVMARFTTTIIGDAERYPVMLSNGNRVEVEDLEDGRRRVIWEDPFPKPSYLFALVAGRLACHEDRFTTRSGRAVRLELWVEPREIDKCEHALRSLQGAMAWDEEVFGLEYDLDLYMIVAVSDFNMGAMENKGLNIFNSKYVLARPDTATDDDFESIEGVIAHEYFHNWTGNRVTCRDWFQLTLKEGLTVFRDQQFSADMTSAPVKRIVDVRTLRRRQFPEDGGPMSHPIRPESYIRMDNFYTATVYEKGAEVIRMLHTLLGRDGFRRGMDLYFERHDGQAVTCDDFRVAMADANGRDLSQFERWYDQSGTPILEARGDWDEASGCFALTLRQRPPAGRPEAEFQPTHVPVRIGLVGPEGRDLPLALEGESNSPRPTERVLELTERETTYHFTGLDGQRPVPSILRGFSAPMELHVERERGELAFLLEHDSDPFNRWDAGQSLFGGVILDRARDLAAGRPTELDPLLVEAFRAVLLDGGIDGSIRALTLSFPDERELAQKMEVIDPDGLRGAGLWLRREIARALREELMEVLEQHRPRGGYSKEKTEIDRRRTANLALRFLVRLKTAETTGLAWDQFEGADNMTDAFAALACLVSVDARQGDRALEAFHGRWKDEGLVLDKWFAVQATSTRPGAVERVRGLAEHAEFQLENPNRVRALVGAFVNENLAGFHDASGGGYEFLADHLLAIDPRNPQLAARLANAFGQWRRFDGARQGLVRGQLERVAGVEGLSSNTREIVERALGG